MVAVAQQVYDGWNQDSSGEDEELGEGGICDEIAEAISGVIAEKISDVEMSDGGQPGDDHAWAVASRGMESYGIDIPCGIYERGSGYRWKKIPGVVFVADHIEIFEVPMEGPEMGVSEGGKNLQGNRFEADVAPNKSRADVKDRKNNRLFILLNREDIEELHELTGELLRRMPE